jgi:hypothetical protein
MNETPISNLGVPDLICREEGEIGAIDAEPIMLREPSQK